MSGRVKWMVGIVLAVLAIAAYGVMAQVTTDYHEHLFPGNNDPQCAHMETGCSVIVGSLWPIGLPIVAGIHLGRRITAEAP